MAHRFNSYSAQSAGNGFILRHRDILRRHALSEAPRLVTTVSDDRFLNTQIDALLRPIGGTHTSIEPRHLQKETDQPNATRTAFDKHHMEGQNQAMKASETRNTFKELDHLGTGIEPLLPRAPRLQRGTGNLEPLSGLTLREPLGLQVAIRFEELSAAEAVPSLVMITMHTPLKIDYTAHSYLLTQPW